MGLRWIVAVAGLFALAGCAQGSPPAQPEPDPLGDPLPFVQWETDTPGVGDGALLEGVVVDHGGCLGVEGDFEVFVPVFPGEMEGRAERLRPGDEVALGGGTASWGSVQGLPGVKIPEGCADAGGYWLVVEG